MLAELVEKIEKENFKKGEKKGEKKGRIETAKAMIKDGLSVTSISKYTGLSEEEIDSIT